MSKDYTTLGALFIDDVPYSKTLEDQTREVPQLDGESDETWVKRWKIYGCTAIPARTYKVLLLRSPRFGNRLMPHIADVPGYTNVMIHPLNTALQSEGCIGVGQESVDAEHSPFRESGKSIPGLLRSIAAFDPLLERLKDCVNRGEEVTLTIQNPEGLHG